MSFLQRGGLSSFCFGTTLLSLLPISQIHLKGLLHSSDMWQLDFQLMVCTLEELQVTCSFLWTAMFLAFQAGLGYPCFVYYCRQALMIATSCVAHTFGISFTLNLDHPTQLSLLSKVQNNIILYCRSFSHLISFFFFFACKGNPHGEHSKYGTNLLFFDPVKSRVLDLVLFWIFNLVEWIIETRSEIKFAIFALGKFAMSIFRPREQYYSGIDM